MVDDPLPLPPMKLGEKAFWAFVGLVYYGGLATAAVLFIGAVVLVAKWWWSVL